MIAHWAPVVPEMTFIPLGYDNRRDFYGLPVGANVFQARFERQKDGLDEALAHETGEGDGLADLAKWSQRAAQRARNQRTDEPARRLGGPTVGACGLSRGRYPTSPNALPRSKVLAQYSGPRLGARVGGSSGSPAGARNLRMLFALRDHRQGLHAALALRAFRERANIPTAGLSVE